MVKLKVQAAALFAVLCLAASAAWAGPALKGDILINTAEDAGFFHSGGLGVMIDAYSQALSARLKERGLASRINVAMPFYMSFYDDPALISSIHDEGREVEVGLDYAWDDARKEMAPRRTEKFRVYSRENGGVKMLFYRHMNREGEPNFFDNKVPKGQRKIYAPSELESKSFIAYDKALAKDVLSGKPGPQVVIENDWHTGPNAYFLKHPEFFGLPGKKPPKILGLVHNLEFQGRVYDRTIVDYAGMDSRDFQPDGISHGGPGDEDHFNSSKILLNYSDMTQTVAAEHAREGTTPRFGRTLEGALERNRNQYRWTGVLNGIDYRKWDPANFTQLVADLRKEGRLDAETLAKLDPEKLKFSADDMSGMARGKSLLQKYFGLPVKKKAMVLAFTSRMDTQKGFRYVPDALRNVLERNKDLQVVFTGDGDARFRGPVEELARDFPKQVRVELFSQIDEKMLLSFADAVGAFSEHEPSGQVHTSAMRMYTVPIATSVGGHAEAIEDGKTGFLAYTYLEPDQIHVDPRMTGKRVEEVIERALDTYRNHPDEWHAIRSRAAARDFSWQRQIDEHLSSIDFMLRDGPARLSRALGPPPAGKIFKPSQLLNKLDALEAKRGGDCLSSQVRAVLQ